MRRINLIVLAFVLFQTFSFAQKNKTNLLVGKWEWIESSGGFGGGILTPKTEAYTIRVEFTKKNIFKSYKDGLFNMQSNLKFISGKSIYSAEPTTIITYYRGKEKDLSMMNDSFEFKGKDTLILKQECHDCYTRTFVRIKK
ncbi:MAG: hypothetical protein ACK50A_08735 [Sphingobacteriaceae bacterium]